MSSKYIVIVNNVIRQGVDSVLQEHEKTKKAPPCPPPMSKPSPQKGGFFGGLTSGIESVISLSSSMVNEQSVALKVIDAVGSAAKSLLSSSIKGEQFALLTLEEVKDFSFAAGHPVLNTLYVRHPVCPTIYCIASDFHKIVFEHKFSELIRILMSLGATRINVNHVKGLDRELGGNFFAQRIFKGGLSADYKNTNESNAIFSASFPGSVNPELCSDLFWLQHEPTWQAIAEARLKFGLKEFNLSLIYNDDYGVNLDLKAAAVASNVEVGGKFINHTATIWHVDGVFL